MPLQRFRADSANAHQGCFTDKTVSTTAVLTCCSRWPLATSHYHTLALAQLSCSLLFRCRSASGVYGLAAVTDGVSEKIYYLSCAVHGGARKCLETPVWKPKLTAYVQDTTPAMGLSRIDVMLESGRVNWNAAFFGIVAVWPVTLYVRRRSKTYQLVAATLLGFNC